MVTRMHVLLVMVLSLLITAVILVIYTKQRGQEHDAYQQTVRNTIMQGAAHAIELKIQEQQKNVHLFANEYHDLIAHLARYPQDEKTEARLKKRLGEHFLNFYNFTIATTRGEPILDDIEAKVGEICQRDISNFSHRVNRIGERPNNPLMIHPTPDHYHYDIMSSITVGNAKRVFFVSFHPDPIAQTLRTHQIPGHELMLVKNGDFSLIELTADGPRDKLNREIRLTEDELKLVMGSREIPDTQWLLIDLPDNSHINAYWRGLWHEAFSILAIVAAANLLIFLIIILQTRETHAEKDPLRQTPDQK